MIKAVLLDLDDTLIGNPTESFVTNYIAALVRYLENRLDIEGVGRAVLDATKQVALNQDPLRTNAETFYARMRPMLPVDPAAFDAAAADFYAQVYPQLRSGTEPRPVARPLVDWLLAEGYRVVVATNPFFPRVAVEQRLDWAGLPVTDVPFALVTTLENMHFSKPHPQYYEEILARLGVQASEAIMVGDDWKNDIAPAACAGLNVYWVDGGTRPDTAQRGLLDGHGSLDDFTTLVREMGWLETLAPRPLEPGQIVPRLMGNVAGVLGAASEVPPAVWAMRPDDGEWSPAEILCHLGASEREVQRPRLQTIAREENPLVAPPAISPGPATQACPEDGWQLALAFAAERHHTLDFLAGLDAAAWDRPATHSRLGQTTLLAMADYTAQHDRAHITQLRETVAKCL